MYIVAQEFCKRDLSTFLEMKRWDALARWFLKEVGTCYKSVINSRLLSIQSVVVLHAKYSRTPASWILFSKPRPLILLNICSSNPCYLISKWRRGNILGLWIVAHATFPNPCITFFIHGRKKWTLVKTWGYLGLLQSSLKVKAVIPWGVLLQISGPPESPYRKGRKTEIE